jgi:hypothetical protein
MAVEFGGGRGFLSIGILVAPIVFDYQCDLSENGT